MGTTPFWVLVACFVAAVWAAPTLSSSPVGFSHAVEASATAQRSACYKWERLNATAQTGPTPRQQHLSWSNYDGSSVFVAGGCVLRDDSARGRCAETIDETLRFDVLSQEWSPLTIRSSTSTGSKVSVSVAEAASAYDIQSDSLIFYGGVESSGKLSSSLRLLTPHYGSDGRTPDALLHASPRTRGDKPPALRGAAMIVHGARLLLHGGIDQQGVPHGQLYVLDLEGANAMVWRRVSPGLVPSARFGHTLSPVPPKPLNDIDAYNAIFASADAAAAAAHAGRGPNVTEPTTAYRVSLVLYGGSDGAAALNDVWHLSGVGSELAWRKVTPARAPGALPPAPRQSHTATVVTSAGRNVLVVLGGCDHERASCSDSAEVLDVDSWVWLPVPSTFASSRMPARAHRVSATEEFFDDDAVAASLYRSHPARASASLTLLPQARTRPRVTLSTAAGAGATQGPRLDKHGRAVFDTPVEEAVVTGHRVVLTLGCAGAACGRAVDSRAVSILDLDAICAGSCAVGRGAYEEESGGGSAQGRDVASEDLSYRPPRCRCDSGFAGRFCEHRHECPAGCSGHGQCVAEVDADGARVMFCRCDPGFWGVDCAQPDCPNHCSGRGVCTAGPDPVFITAQLDAPSLAGPLLVPGLPAPGASSAAADAAARGDDAHALVPVPVPGAERAVPRARAQDAALRLSHCECRRGFHGPDCSLVLTPQSRIRCERDCSGHGLCSADGKCLCDAGFTGSDCSRQCPALCSGRGICVEGGPSPAAIAADPRASAAAAAEESFGVDLARAAAVPSGSSSPVCQCRKGFTGPDCSVRYCVHNCFGRGDCVDGRCRCKDGWGGEFCTIPTKCSGHGDYVEDAVTGEGRCSCHPGWGNPLCSQQVFCPRGCSGHGVCAVLPPVSALSRLLRRPVGRDAFAATPLGSVLPTVNSEDAAVGAALADPSASHAALFRSLSPDQLEEMGVDVSLLELSALAAAEAAAAADLGLALDGPAGTAGASGRSAALAVEVEGVCKCREGWRGVDCSMRECSARCRPGQGECDDDGRCRCFPGFTGEDCGEVVPCRANCTSPVHGTCAEPGVCRCRPGWSGPDCATPRCPGDCSGHGTCDVAAGVCKCEPGFSGPDCTQECPNHCSGKGTCINGSCACDPGYSGRDCSQAARCPRSQFLHPDLDCSGHGFCFRPARKCVCEPGYTGRDCSQDDGSCGQGSCGSHGTCRHGQCFCDLGWSGAHCELQNQCPSNCHGHGFCVHGSCECYRGFTGSSCETPVADKDCPNDCSGNGFCRAGKCVCVEGHTGPDCSKTTGFCAENDCSGRGKCRFGKCHCEPGAEGTRCEKTGCGDCAIGKGVCVLGVCQCLPGFRGPACALEDRCPAACSGHGICVLGTCSCIPGYTGKDCSIIAIAPEPPLPIVAAVLTAPAAAAAGNASAGNGTDAAGNTTDAANTTAAAVTAAVALSAPLMVANTTTGCPLDCSGMGVCHLGRCFCVDGHIGAGCESLVPDACPNNCGGDPPNFDQRGICHFGKCFCKPGFEGPGCEVELLCPATCSRNGVCLNGQCFCAPGYAGAACELTLAAHAKDALFASDLGSGADAPSAVGWTVVHAAEPFSVRVNAAKQEKWKQVDIDRAAEREQIIAKEKAVAEAAAQAALAAAASKDAADYDKAAKDAKDKAAKAALLEAEAEGSADAAEAEASFLELESRTSRGGASLAPGSDAVVYGFSSDVDAAASAVAAAEAEARMGAPVRGGPGASFLMTRATTVAGPAPIACGPSAGGCKHGVCLHNQCMCLPGYAGVDCSVTMSVKDWERCPKECSNQGTCVNGRCFCHYGFAGEACQTRMPLPCPRDCSGHGVCRHGKCFCEPGFGGIACAVVLACPDDCGSHGVCFRGQCICADGFTGSGCRTALPPGALPDRVRASVHASRDDISLFRFTNPAVEDLDSLKDVLASPEALAEVKRASASVSAQGDKTAAKADAKKPEEQTPAGASSFIDVLSSLSEPVELTGLVVDSRVRKELAVSMALAADEHAFACLDGCGAHGRCLAGRCFCEPGYAGALCHLALDADTVAAFEESRRRAEETDGAEGAAADAAALRGLASERSVVATARTVSPLVLLAVAFCAGALLQSLATRALHRPATAAGARVAIKGE